MAEITNIISFPGSGQIVLMLAGPSGDFMPGDRVMVAGVVGAEPDVNGVHVVLAVLADGQWLVIAGELTTPGTGGTAEHAPDLPRAVVPIQLKRGGNAAVAGYLGGADNGGTAAEPVWDAERRQLRVFDGTMPGGTLIGPEMEVEYHTYDDDSGPEMSILTIRPRPELIATNFFNLETPTTGGGLIVTGLLLGPRPDGTANGGNVRGRGAIDLQVTRDHPDEVAAAPASFICGRKNKVHPNAGELAFVIGESAYAQAGGALVQAYGMFAEPGDAQASRTVVRRLTGNNTPQNLVGVQGYNDTTTLFDIRVVARSTNGADAAAFHRRIVTQKVGNGITSIVGSMQTIGTDIKSAGAAAWDLVYTAPNNVQCVGAADTLIRWVALVDTVEVRFPAP